MCRGTKRKVAGKLREKARAESQKESLSWEACEQDQLLQSGLSLVEARVSSYSSIGIGRARSNRHNYHSCVTG